MKDKNELYLSTYLQSPLKKSTRLSRKVPTYIPSLYKLNSPKVVAKLYSTGILLVFVEKARKSALKGLRTST